MAPSQLKQLKASLHDHGVLGPQKSKKVRKQTSKDAGKRLQRNAALQGIRERFNPFEVKQSARKDKFDVTSNKPAKKNGPGRPGVTKGLGEERRRATLLKEIQSRSKVGGILDRRFGENDPTMTPEQRAAERFARQSERKLKKSSIFNLEDDDEEEVQLTHGGRSLTFGDVDGHDDFGDDEAALSGEEDNDRPRKRQRLSDGENSQGESEGAEDGLPERHKSKQEVMKEVIAKSKLYKYERQQAKEDDDELRAELDRGLPEFYEALRNQRLPTKPPPLREAADSDPTMNPDRAALLAGKDREDADKEYNERVRQMAMDMRSKPADRTKTEEEKVAEEAEKLRDLERERLRRMRGQPESSDEEDDPDPELPLENEHEDQDDAQLFGLGQSHDKVSEYRELAVEDEDEFVLDEDLIASNSDAEMATDVEDIESQGSLQGTESEGDDDLINGLVLPQTPSSQEDQKLTNGIGDAKSSERNLAFTFPCPQTREELLEIAESASTNDLPTIVQRIRALYHPQLAAGNKAKLEQFSRVLTEYVAQLGNDGGQCPSSVLETLLRHLHSLAKSFPEAVGSTFRAHLQRISNERPLRLGAGDMTMLTGISAIFPTSDHFHSVVTPANLVLARYLGQSSVQTLGDLAIGSYCCTLALQYQHFSKRYVPECMTYLVNAILALAPTALKDPRILVPRRLPDTSLRLTADLLHDPGPLKSVDFQARPGDEGLKVRLLRTFVALLDEAADLWQDKTAFYEIFEPAAIVLDHLAKSCSSRRLLQSNHVFIDLLTSLTKKLQDRRLQALAVRRPLLLHNHRPLAIKTSIPKFEESYNPDRHYDPDRERSELNKLKAEHKRERKGAMRELRKDANFIARENLREKKEKDAAYEKKFKRLVAEIQGEEGKEAKEYEREKRKRKGKW
jgi:nucleolar protein 14